MQIEYSVLKVSKNGNKVTLNDGSQWEISPGDSTKCCLWYPAQRIQIKKVTGIVYQYQLINRDTFEPDIAECQQTSGSH